MKRSTALSSGHVAPSLLVASLLAAASLLLPIAGAAVAIGNPPAPSPAPALAGRDQPAPSPAQATASPPAASPQPDPTPNMTTYYVALLRRGPDWTPTMTPAVTKALEGHMANIRRLVAAGDLLLAGPFLEQTGPGSLTGLFVLQARSLAEAKQLVDTDPAVQAGRFVAEVLPWLGPKSLQTLNPPHPGR